MRDRTLVVLTAGLTQPSSSRLLADRLAAATQAELAGLDIRAEPHIIEAREHAHDVTNHLLTGFPPPALQPVIDTLRAADGLITVTPIFNASYSGLFKSFLDVLDAAALADKPVLIAATGGTARHSLALEHALRPLFVHLGAVVVPTSVYAAAEDWAPARAGDRTSPERESRRGPVGGPVGGPERGRGPGGDTTTEDMPGPEHTAPGGEPAPMHVRIRRAARELAVQMSLREPATVTDPFALTATFEDLIADHRE